MLTLADLKPAWAHAFLRPDGNTVIFSDIPTHGSPEEARACLTPKSLCNEIFPGWKVAEPVKVLRTHMGIITQGIDTREGPLGIMTVVSGPYYDDALDKMKAMGMTIPNLEDQEQLQVLVDKVNKEDAQSEAEAKGAPGIVGHA